jgi:hypothetical protein
MMRVYLAGEIHSNWREEIIQLSEKEKLDITFTSPVIDHEASDNCGVEILGVEEKESDVIIVKFGEKYKQWNAAFDAGYAAALNKSIIVIHNEEHQHALKEVDASAAAVASDQKQAFQILKYILKGILR